MNFSIRISDWQAAAPGLSTTAEWQEWVRASNSINSENTLAKCQHLPMMMARRLSAGSRAAVDTGLALMQKHSVDALVYSSRHGELEKNYRILEALHQQVEQSPTVFAMSVHNAAVGTTTISGKAELVSKAIYCLQTVATKYCWLITIAPFLIFTYLTYLATYPTTLMQLA